MIVASPEDIIYINLKDKSDVDIDDTYKVKAIKEIIYDYEDGVFFILANKLDEKLGFFVFTIEQKNPLKHKFYIKYRNKLDIGDTDISVLRDAKNRVKELIISYKTIYINTYNIIVLDISEGNSEDVNKVIFRHETFQLWESEIKGFLISKNLDFVTINKNGLNILALSENHKRVIVDNQG
jgi:hypothetical protein